MCIRDRNWEKKPVFLKPSFESCGKQQCLVYRVILTHWVETAPNPVRELALVIMKIPCMNKSMVIMNNGQLIINSLWSNSIHEQLFIKLLWTTDHAWTIGLSIWTIDHMANCSCMNKLFIIYEQLFIISKIVHKLFIAWTIGHSMDNPSDIHKILNGCFLFFRFITKDNILGISL